MKFTYWGKQCCFLWALRNLNKHFYCSLGNKKVKTRRVKDVIREAEKEVADLKAKDTSTGFTPRASESNNKTTNGIDLDSDDDDDDMSDIFERARKKYNLEIDDETMSRSRKWCHWVTKIIKIIEQNRRTCVIMSISCSFRFQFWNKGVSIHPIVLFRISLLFNSFYFPSYIYHCLSYLIR